MNGTKALPINNKTIIIYYNLIITWNRESGVGRPEVFVGVMVF